MRGILALLLLAACEPAAPSWELTRPAVAPAPLAVPAPPAAAAPAPAPVPAAASGFDFEHEDRPAEDAVEKPSPGEEDPNVLQARLLGVPLAARPTAPAAGAIPDVPPTVPGFGIRLISVVTDVQPPMAVIGLPNGDNVVVKPGQMLPDLHLVVLAIGRTAIQVAEVVPEGFSTRVVTTTVPALYPAAGAGSPGNP
jgi:hypothetical protein